MPLRPPPGEESHSAFSHTLNRWKPARAAVFVDEYESATDDRQAFNNSAVKSCG